MDAALLREHHCFFGGGTAIALRYREYRESVDIDFLVSELASYRNLRQLVTGPKGLLALWKQTPGGLQVSSRGIRADQYGIRCMLEVMGAPIKFEIVLEGRIEFDEPETTDVICGVPTLTVKDLAASKLLANSDRWADSGVFSRDLIDLAMMDLPLKLLRSAVFKAEQAYGTSISRDLAKAIEHMRSRDGWLDRCIQAMAMDIPRAVLWSKVRKLQKVCPAQQPGV
ncbi:MAG: nucleotidyl transferase AbiEii/AbiGii toxin family protein [Porticoccaceae bacterium]|nr:nucleotidyl transferase AbiEii/AbiGii toxin family protein [Porticoccaceae bacterium]